MKAMKSFKCTKNYGAWAKVWIVFLVLSISFSNSGYGQSAPVRASSGIPGGTKQPSSVTIDKFTGCYQLPNKIAFIEFEGRDSMLFAKQLWDNKEYQLVRMEGTTFETKNEGHKIEFIEDASGSVNQAKMLGRIMTTKVDFDPRKVIELSPKQLGRLEGTYILNNDSGRKITIQSSGKGLLLKQIWDNKVIDFTPRSESFFLNADGTFPLSFLSENGKVKQVTCFENDVWEKQL